ncbi:hypothetical protein BHM03_00063107 [Ensete ventricosum]|nr:hypothetical protein BHM03_00063107 [Ensete ventricosum]
MRATMSFRWPTGPQRTRVRQCKLGGQTFRTRLGSETTPKRPRSLIGEYCTPRWPRPLYPAFIGSHSPRGKANCCQLKEQKVDHRKVDDELLKLMRENEPLKAEQPGRSVANYKQSVRFGWGLQQMGQVSYEYEYQVALAHFQARYPDLEVNSIPFTEQPEDSSVPMEYWSTEVHGSGPSF